MDHSSKVWEHAVEGGAGNGKKWLVLPWMQGKS
jgi:hypothetical protein